MKFKLPFLNKHQNAQAASPPPKPRDYRIPTQFYGGDMDFWAYTAADYSDEEQEGRMQWSGDELGYIRSRVSSSLPDLPPALEKLIAHAWTCAQVSPAATRPSGGIRLADSRSEALLQRVARLEMPPKDSEPIAKAFDTDPIKANLAPHLKTKFALDWTLHNSIPRVRAFTFRGDTRDPAAIKKAGGFSPPNGRTDTHYLEKTVYEHFASYLKRKIGLDISIDQFRKILKETLSDDLKKQFFHYGIWRALADQEALHLGRMVAKEDLKGYTSTTRAVTVAKGYARTGGWVYLLSVEGAYVLPKMNAHEWTKIFSEQEVAMPGPVPWEKIQGFRQVTGENPLNFTGPIYLRDTYDKFEPDAASEAFMMLSGKAQG